MLGGITPNGPYHLARAVAIARENSIAALLEGSVDTCVELDCRSHMRPFLFKMLAV